MILVAVFSMHMSAIKATERVMTKMGMGKLCKSVLVGRVAARKG